MNIDDVLVQDAIALLKQLIRTPSYSREEDATASIIELFLQEKGISSQRLENNIHAQSKEFVPSKPTILLNSHHDTVKPAAGYSRDPFNPTIEDDKLFGLGSNDAGGALVALIAAFRYFYDKKNLNFNLILALTAEEEISGANGISLLIPELKDVTMGIVGEPTLMQMAVAEKGLMVLDCKAKGLSGHAARNEGKNAIYLAMRDIEWFRTYQFEKESELLGPVRMTTTIINAGQQHNQVPDECGFTVDIRTTDAYTNEELLAIIHQHISAEIVPRSTRLQPSAISQDHPLVMAGKELSLKTYGSPTLSDQALVNFPTVKIGPGNSARSHTADEFIFLKEIEEGISGYISLLNKLNETLG